MEETQHENENLIQAVSPFLQETTPHETNREKELNNSLELNGLLYTKKMYIEPDEGYYRNKCRVHLKQSFIRVFGCFTREVTVSDLSILN